MSKGKCILAYSGGMDSTISVVWIKEKYDLDVIPVVAPLNSNTKTFNIYNDNFIASIESIALSIENEDSVSLMENFNIMASNCGTCHKKFKN